MSLAIKICGITTVEAVEAAAGADYLGFIFYAPSPRNITPEKASMLAAKSTLPSVAVTVDATDAVLEEIIRVMRPSLLQLHGSESPERVKAIRAQWNIPVIKAFPVRVAKDIEVADTYSPVADMLLFDAKPLSSALPGGTGESFDWNLLAGHSFARPWFLSGGLDADNVGAALEITKAQKIDVSSRLESTPGIKDPAKIRHFITICRKIAV